MKERGEIKGMIDRINQTAQLWWFGQLGIMGSVTAS